jgi:uncharacterized membrane protein
MTSLENAIEKSIDVHAPVSTVYNQWTRFEDFPKFMEGILEVRRLDENRLHWRATSEGQEREWDSEIIEQTPDTRIAWTSAGGLARTGMVSFASIYHGTRVTLQMSHDPDLPADQRDALALRMTRILERFKEFLESTLTETETGAGSD